MNYANLNFFDTMNGDGVRVSLFVSGCSLNCKGCFNKEMQNFRYGQPYTEDVEQSIIEALANPDIKGLSILGGEPLELKNLDSVINLCELVRDCHPDKDIWLWSGHTYAEISSHPDRKKILALVDVLIDGRFEEKQKNSNLQYRGSENQKMYCMIRPD